MEFESILLPGVDAKRPLLIAGPCSAETEEQVMETARKLSARGIKIFRAGVWKPRTKPGGFEGNGIKALPWLKRVKEELGTVENFIDQLCEKQGLNKGESVSTIQERKKYLTV